MSASDVAAAAAREAQQEADAAMLPNTPQEPRSPLAHAHDDSLPAVGVASSSAEAPPSMAELMSYLVKQNDRLNAVVEMMAYDRKNPEDEKKKQLI